MASFWCLYCWLWTYLTSCSSVSIVNFKHVIAGWVKIIPGKRHSKPFFNFYSSKSLSLLCFIDMTLMQTLHLYDKLQKAFTWLLIVLKIIFHLEALWKIVFFLEKFPKHFMESTCDLVFPGKVSQNFMQSTCDLVSFQWTLLNVLLIHLNVHDFHQYFLGMRFFSGHFCVTSLPEEYGVHFIYFPQKIHFINILWRIIEFKPARSCKKLSPPRNHHFRNHEEELFPVNWTAHSM